MTMNRILTLIGLVISINVYGQELNFKDKPVDTVKISSNTSYYHFDTLGTTTGIYDEYIITYNSEKKDYFLHSYNRVKYKITFLPDTIFEIKRTINKDVLIDRQLLSNLLLQFEISYSKPTFDNLGLSAKQFLKLTNKKQIIKVAKRHKVDWRFKKDYSTKDKNEVIFKSCQSIDTFNMYLNSTFDSTSSYRVITDIDDNFYVTISTSDYNHQYEGKYPNPFKQPWYVHSTNNILDTISILNLSINLALSELLPKQFSRLSTLQIEALTNDYIEWYLKRINKIK